MLPHAHCCGMQLPQYEIDPRHEIWVGSAVELIFYIGNALGSWWLLNELEFGRQQLLAVPLLALGLLMFEGFAIRKFSDRIATAFVLVGVAGLAIALLIIATWLQNDFPR